MLRRWLYPFPAGMLEGLLFAVLVLVPWLVAISARHEARAARAETCRAKVELFVARNPLAAKGYVWRADDCVNLVSLTGETR